MLPASTVHSYLFVYFFHSGWFNKRPVLKLEIMVVEMNEMGTRLYSHHGALRVCHSSISLRNEVENEDVHIDVHC